MSDDNIFSKLSRLNGTIKYLDLQSWWMDELSENERNLLLDGYPIFDKVNPEIEAEVYSPATTHISFIKGLAEGFNNKEKRYFAHKLIAKAESLIEETSDPIDIHFLYSLKVVVCYRDRDAILNGLELAIEACEQQIKISPTAAKAFTKKYRAGLPTHIGFTQLIIIMDKKKRYAEAISLCQEAKLQGWAGNWDKRIATYNDKANKTT